MIDLQLLQRLTVHQACAQLVGMVQELRARQREVRKQKLAVREKQAAVSEQKAEIRRFLRYYGCHRKMPWISWATEFAPMARMARAAILIGFCMLLSGCHLIQPDGEDHHPKKRTNAVPLKLAPPPPAEARGLASLNWAALSGAEAYRVDYGAGLSVAEMTNSLVTGATNCIIPDLIAGQRYLFQVRGIVVNQFGQPGKTYSKPISLGVFEAQ